MRASDINTHGTGVRPAKRALLPAYSAPWRRPQARRSRHAAARVQEASITALGCKRVISSFWDVCLTCHTMAPTRRPRREGNSMSIRGLACPQLGRKSTALSTALLCKPCRGLSRKPHSEPAADGVLLLKCVILLTSQARMYQQ